MPDVNKVTLLGFVGETPEFRSTPDGKYSCYLLLTTTSRVRDSMGAWMTVVHKNRVVLLNDLAVQAHTSLKRGDQAHIEGCLKTRKWIDKVTNDVIYFPEVVAESLEILGVQGKGVLGTHSHYHHHGQSDGARPFSAAVSGASEQSDTVGQTVIETILKTTAMAWQDVGSTGRWVADFRF